MEISLDQRGPVYVVTWNDGENRIHHDSLALLNSQLDEIERVEGPCALVLTGAGKFFSNGLDLARFGDRPSEFSATLAELKRTVGRLLLFRAYSVAAINGHCFAGGALLSCGFDYRVMREDRGYWCMNEVEIGLALDDDLWSILRHRLPRATAIEAAITARRYGALDAQRSGIVESIASEERLVDHAVEVATRYATLDRATLARHKALAHASEARRLGWT